MAFTSLDSVIAALASGNSEDSFFQKPSITTTTGRWYSHWTTTGLPSAGSAAGSAAGAACTSSTTGAMKFTAPTGSHTKHGIRFGLGGPTAGVAMIYDRLVHTSALSGTSTSAQTVSSTALTRHTDGLGVLCAIEVYSALGSTSVTATVSYTDTDDNTGNSGTITIPASALAGEFIIPMAMASGDKGVKSVQTVTLSATTGTAGNFGITLYYPIATIGYDASKYTERDLVVQLASLPTLVSNTCLAVATLATTTSTGIQFGTFGMAEG